MNAQDKTQDENARKASAESLRRQIEDLKEGRIGNVGGLSLRDFIEKKMAEDRANLKKKPA